MGLVVKWNLSDACASDILQFSRKICGENIILLSHLFVTSSFDIRKRNTNSIQNKNKCFTKNYWVSLEVSWLHTSFVYQSKSSTRNLNKQINQIWITRVFYKCNKYQG